MKGWAADVRFENVHMLASRSHFCQIKVSRSNVQMPVQAKAVLHSLVLVCKLACESKQYSLFSVPEESF